MTRTTMPLPCPLSTEVVADRADQHASATMQLVALELEKKAANAAFKERHVALSEAIKTLAAQVHTKSEMREVEIERVADERRFVVETFRLDSGELVSSRKMNKDEQEDALQAKLPFGPPSGNDGAKA